jgi:hypothetical protein
MGLDSDTGVQTHGLYDCSVLAWVSDSVTRHNATYSASVIDGVAASVHLFCVYEDSGALERCYS